MEKTTLQHSTPQNLAGGGTPSKERNSNLELFRIILMLLIIAAHYINNASMVLEGGPIYANPTSWRSYFLLSFGAWGKTAINGFVLITGYFMCKSSISLKKWLKLFLEIELYHVVCYLIFWLAGYENFSIMNLIRALLPVTQLTSNFVGCYLVFYLLIPFLNMLLQKTTEKQHILLLVVLFFAYTVIDTVPKFFVNLNYVAWFPVVYLVGAYIRIYPHELFQKKRFWGVTVLVSVIVSVISVCAMTFLMNHFNILFNHENSYYFLSDSNKIFAVLTAVSAFLFFKNIRIRQSRLINTVAASTFGVLLIHLSVPSKWLWNDIWHTTEMYFSPNFILHLIASVLTIYIVCTAIDYLRIKFLEKPFFRFYDRHYDAWRARIFAVGNRLCEKLHIQEEKS